MVIFNLILAQQKKYAILSWLFRDFVPISRGREKASRKAHNLEIPVQFRAPQH